MCSVSISLSVRQSVTNAPTDPAQRSPLETRLYCVGLFGPVFAKLLCFLSLCATQEWFMYFGSHLAMFYIHHMNEVNSCNNLYHNIGTINSIISLLSAGEMVHGSGWMFW